MSTRWKWPVAAVALAGAAAAVVWLWPRDPASQASAQTKEPSLLQPQRPSTPPVPGRDRPQRVPMPELPPRASEIQAAAYAEAKAAGETRPGEKAFRATVDAFMKYNRAFAEEQAREEGITVDEVGELTYFGFMVMQTQRWTEVQELVGTELDEDTRAAGEALMHTANVEFKGAMRKLVAEGAPAEARWKLIRDTQERYLSEYYALTGMTPELLDDLLAGDITREGAPVVTPPPEDIEPAPAPPRVEQRPGQTP